MSEKLIVRGFAGIKDLEIDVKQINILIGPQASGKSVRAKLLFFFKSFPSEILSTIENEQRKSKLDSDYSKTFEEYFPPESWGHQNFFIRYEISSVFVEISRKQDVRGQILLNYSETFKKELIKLRALQRKIEDKSLEKDEKYEPIYKMRARRVLRDSLNESLQSSLCKEVTFAQLYHSRRSFFFCKSSKQYIFFSFK